MAGRLGPRPRPFQLIEWAAMTDVNEHRAFDTDENSPKSQSSPKSLWEQREEEQRRLGPALTEAQLHELRALGRQLLNPQSD